MTNQHWDFTEALCVCVRAFTIPQAQRFTGIRDRSNFMRFLKPLEAHDFVRVVTVPAKRVPEMMEPLFACDYPIGSYGDLPANDILRLARARWAGFPAVPQRVVIGTKRARQLHGVNKPGESLRHPYQATHDTALSEVFVHKVINGLIQAGNWYSEDACDFQFDKHRPDAFEVSQDNNLPVKLIEVVGEHYTQHKLISLYEECNSRGGISIEYW